MRVPIALPKSNRSRALAAGGVLAAVVMVAGLVTVFTSGGTGPDPLPDGEKPPAEIAFSDRPAWDERKLGMVRVAGIELRGGTAIVAGDVGAGGARLAVVDVRTGEPRWVVDGGSPLTGGDGADAHHGFGYRAEHLRGVTGDPLVYGNGDDWIVPVQYTEGRRGAETEIGVAALSGKDGAVRWKHALIRPRSGKKGDEDREQKVRLLAADSRVVLTSVEGEQATDPATVALDAATGRKLWEHEGGWAHRFAGDLVLGETRGERAPSTDWGAQRKGTDVFALDVRTGQKRWDLSGAFGSSHLDAVAGGTAVVNVRDTKPGTTSAAQRTLLLDTATGRETGSAGSDGGAARNHRIWGCADDGRELIACGGSGGRLVTIRHGRGNEPFTTEKPPFGEESLAHVHLVHEDRIFVHASPGENRPARHAVVDRAANRIGSAPSGEVAAVSRTAAAFRVRREGSSSSTPDGLAVHAAAVGAEPPEPAGPGRPALEPPRIDAAPLWTAKTGETPPASASPQAKETGLVAVETIRLAGDALVYTGRDAEDDDLVRQVVADVETGEVRWSVREGASLGGGAEAASMRRPHVVDMGDEWLTFVEYSGPGEEEGIAALSLKDGSVRWKKRTMSGNGFAILMAVDRKTIAVSTWRGGGSADGQDGMAVYATGTRKELWRKRGVTPESTGGGLVLAAEDGPRDGGTRKRRDLIAYGASDGERKWRLGDRYREPELLHDEGGATIVVGTPDGGAVLDRATGRELARTHTPLLRCDGDGDALIVCESGTAGPGTDGGRRAVTIQTRDGVTKVRDLLETGFLTRYGAIGNWFTAIRPATRSRSGSAPERFLVLDAEGREISADLPGRPREIGGGHAVLTPSTITRGLGTAGVPAFTVHRVRR